MQYTVTYTNPNNAIVPSYTETYDTVAGVNRIKRRARQYPGSCVILSITKTSSKGVTTQVV